MNGTNLRPINKKEAHLVKKYLPDVQKYVNIVRRRHEIPNHIPPNDLYSAGLWGLLLAVKRVKDVDERCIRRYIYLRVRGAVLDELRSLDILPHSARLASVYRHFAMFMQTNTGVNPTKKQSKSTSTSPSFSGKI